ncbi:MAG: vWA domain-containing protein [bacterium]|nr:vWA domain-containing protein [bacterium]
MTTFFLFILALLALIFLTLLFKKERKIPKIIRIVSFLLVLGFIFEPICELVLWSRPWLLVLVDTSKSMEVGGRLESAKRVIAELKIRNKIYGFDSHPYLMRDSITIKGEETNIGNAILETPNPAAYLLLTDGINNSGPDPVEVARYKNIPIYTIKLDSIHKDIFITEIACNKIAYTKDSVVIKAKFEKKGYEEQKVQAILKERGRILQKKEILLPKNGLQKEVEFSVIPDVPGTHLYEVGISELPEELSYENNKREFGIRILKSRIKVGWFALMPSWNFKFAKLELKENQNIEFNYWVKLDEEKWLSKNGVVGAPDFKTAYDVVVLDEFEYPNIEKLVSNGMGVIILGAACKSVSPFIIGHPIQLKTRYPVKVEAGFDIFGAEELPPLKEVYSVLGIKGGSKVLCRTQATPIIAEMKYNKGIVVGIAAKDLWRWNFYPGVKFWDKIVRLVTKPIELPTLWVETEPAYPVGERIILKAQAYTKDYEPDTKCEIIVKVWSAKPKILQKAVSLYSLGNGRYEGVIDFLYPGEYEYEACIAESRQAYPEDKRRARGTFFVTSNLEFYNLDPNLHLLQTISQVSGGRYGENLKNLDIKLKPIKSKIQLNPTQYPIFFIILIILLSLEWIFLRK